MEEKKHKQPLPKLLTSMKAITLPKKAKVGDKEEVQEAKQDLSQDIASAFDYLQNKKGNPCLYCDNAIKNKGNKYKTYDFCFECRPWFSLSKTKTSYVPILFPAPGTKGKWLIFHGATNDVAEDCRRHAKWYIRNKKGQTSLNPCDCAQSSCRFVKTHQESIATTVSLFKKWAPADPKVEDPTELAIFDTAKMDGGPALLKSATELVPYFFWIPDPKLLRVIDATTS